MILLVEDNPNDVALTLRAFKKQNISSEIVVAQDGAEALDFLFCTGEHHLRNSEALPELILLDLKLPRVDGLEVLRKMRQHPNTRFLPVVMLTTSEENSDVLASYQLGANSYIRKPVDYDTFVEAIGNLTYYWLKLNITPKKF